jgi:hypothetical protein
MQDFLKLFIAADKPDWLTAPDFAVMVYLLNLPDRKIRVSKPTIAKHTGLGETAVTSALATLKRENYIGVISGKRQYNANLYEVLHQNLPTTKAPATAVSEDAVAMASFFCKLWLQHCNKYVNAKGRRCTRPLRHDWKTRWPITIQTLLDAGNTPSVIARQFEWFAVNKPKAFRAGPQGLLAMWPKEAK